MASIMLRTATHHLQAALATLAPMRDLYGVQAYRGHRRSLELRAVPGESHAALIAHAGASVASWRFPATSEQGLRVPLDWDAVQDLLPALPPRAEIRLSATDRHLRLEAGCEIALALAESDLPEPPPAQTWTPALRTPLAPLSDGIARLLPFAPRADVREYLNGVRLSWDADGHAELVASQGHVVGRLRNLPLGHQPEPGCVLIPTPVAESLSILDAGDALLDLALGPDAARIAIGDFEAIVPRRLRQTVDFDKAMAHQDVCATVALEREALLAATGLALRAMRGEGSPYDRGVSLAACDPGVLRLQSTLGDRYSEHFRQTLVGDYSGELPALSLLPEYLIRGLAAVRGPQVRIEYWQLGGAHPSIAPCLSETDAEQGTHLEVLIMPRLVRTIYERKQTAA